MGKYQYEYLLNSLKDAINTLKELGDNRGADEVGKILAKYLKHPWENIPTLTTETVEAVLSKE